MKSEQLSPDLDAGQQPISSPSAFLLARGSGAAPCPYLWGLCQREDSVFIRTTDAWVEALRAGLPREEFSPGSPDSDDTLAIAGELENPTTGAASSVHSIFANPGSRDGCTSDVLHHGGGQGFSWRDLEHAVSVLAARHTVEQLIPCKNSLCALVQSGDADSKGEQRIFTTSLETQPQWSELARPERSDTEGRRISHLVSFDESLYSTIDDETAGFQLWRLAGSPDVAAEWTQIIDRGGQDYSSSARVTAVYADSEQLLLACAPCAGLAMLEQHTVGPELILLRPDNSWDLIVGTTRLTPEGLLVPRSLMGRGFDHAAARQIASISRCEGCFHVTIVAPAAEGEQLRGEIWSSEDLCSWSRVSLPCDIRAQDATLVSALRSDSTTLLVMKRQPSTDSVESGRTSSALEVPGLLRDVEFWLLPGGD